MPSTAPERPIHIPAWKRVGLQLKLQPAQTNSVNTESIKDNNIKRKRSKLNCNGDGSKLLKKSEPDLANSELLHVRTSSPSRKRLVSFTPKTKAEDGDSVKKLFNNWIADQELRPASTQASKAETIPDAGATGATPLNSNGEKSKRIKRSKLNVATTSKELNPKAASLTVIETPPFLKYIREFSESKQSWKFNKNHQTHLLKHIFDLKYVPLDHAHLIYAYIRELKGQVRTRLRDEALAIKVKDQEDGTAGFPSTMPDLEQRQKEYESALSKYIATNLSSHAQKMGLEEDFVMVFKDELMKSRIAKRIRAETILNELAFSPHEDNTSYHDTQSKKDLQNSQPKAKLTSRTSRKRKQRTVNLSDSSSDESKTSDGEMTDSSDNEKSSSSNSSSASSSSSESESNGE